LAQIDLYVLTPVNQSINQSINQLIAGARDLKANRDVIFEVDDENLLCKASSVYSESEHSRRFDVAQPPRDALIKSSCRM